MSSKGWSGYDQWRIHGNRHKCHKCGSYWYDSDGGCDGCDVDDEKMAGCYFCGREFPEVDCEPADAFNNKDGGSICPICVDERTG